ncbi:MAG TPA: hypothetical protein VE088_01470 [Gaiellaceae bacterium]|nr:hypothetical protein [Gaiellaceae bacterium]
MRLLIVQSGVLESRVPPYRLAELEGVAAELVTAAEATGAAHAEEFDAIVILPPLAASAQQTLCQQLRQAGVTAPVLALLGLSTVQDRVDVLDAGADDCVGGPVERQEVVARLFALTRRRRRPGSPSVGRSR